jgi:hypothetical protein
VTSWNIQRVLNAFGVNLWPEITLKFEPMGSDEDVEWFHDLFYCHDLADAVENEIDRHGHLLFPYGPTVEDILKESLSPAARRAICNPWPTFEELWRAA